MADLFFQESRLDESINLQILLKDSIYTYSSPRKFHSLYKRLFNPRLRVWSSYIDTEISSLTPFENLVASQLILDVDRSLLDAWICTISKANLPGSTDCSIAIEKRRRHYWNNEGVNYTTETIWCDLLVRHSYIGYVETITDGLYNIENINYALESCINELKIRINCACYSNSCRNLFQKEKLVLSPTVAAVLFHELIGHGSEEIGMGTWINLFPVIGPEYMQVTSIHPNQDGFDDEGIPVSEIRLVEHGQLLRIVTDRERGLRDGGHPSGLAQAGTHGSLPHVRCTHLTIFGGQKPAANLIVTAHKGIFCSATSGAEFHAGVAVVRVKAARCIENGQLESTVAPFQFIISLNELRNHLVELASDSTIGRSGRCVKYSEAIPTQTSAPTTLLVDVPVIKE